MLKLMLVVYLIIVAQMSFVWLLYRVSKNPSIVDVAWSLGLMTASLIFLWAQADNFRILVISCFLIAWALRLAGFLWFTRIRKGHVDKRYLQLSDSWKIAKPLGFFLNFQLQGVLILVISLSFLFAGSNSPSTLGYWDYAGCLLVSVGIIGEAIADWQLNLFKQTQPGKVCDIGLWYYSRHPNYFFEFCVWCGFFLFSLQNNYGWLGIISPLCLYGIFSQLTIPITEIGSLNSRGGAYRDYQNRTSKLIPWFKKSAND